MNGVYGKPGKPHIYWQPRWRRWVVAHGLCTCYAPTVREAWAEWQRVVGVRID